MTFTPEHLATIRTLHALGVTQAELAREYDTTPYTIKRIVCEPDYQPPCDPWRTKQWREEQRERKWQHRDRGVNAKLNREKARDIKTRLARGERGDAIAAYYDVTESEISLIRSGKRWADVQAGEEGQRSG